MALASKGAEAALVRTNGGEIVPRGTADPPGGQEGRDDRLAALDKAAKMRAEAHEELRVSRRHRRRARFLMAQRREFIENCVDSGIEFTEEDAAKFNFGFLKDHLAQRETSGDTNPTQSTSST